MTTNKAQMVSLYHFTYDRGLEGILRDRVIRRSKAIDGRTAREDFAVCLTSDSNCDGHGLPDGREVERADVQSLIVRSENGKNYSRDHTAFRLKVEFSDNDPLLSDLPDVSVHMMRRLVHRRL